MLSESAHLTENTTFADFFLLGLGTTPKIQKFLFVVFFIIYIATIGGNIMIVVIILHNSCLHKPMYFFLVNLSMLEIFYTTTITPNTLRNFLTDDRTISFIGCFVQMFFFIGLGSSECVLLAAMAYDRYIAICQPLFYSTHMNPSFCVFLVVLACVIGFLNSLVHTLFTASLPFCSDHKIDHFFCDIPPLLKLSCTNSQINELVALFVGGCVIVGSLILTLISYACILRAVLGMSSLSGRHKTFSTCGSHLTVVTFYFGTVILTYLLPTSISSSDQARVLSIVYGIVTPLVNPIIYSFRNKDFQRALNTYVAHGNVYT